jgi:hypothetical protein
MPRKPSGIPLIRYSATSSSSDIIEFGERGIKPGGGI